MARIAQLSRSGMPQYVDDLKARLKANRLTASVFTSEEEGSSLLTEDAHYTALRPNGILDAPSMMKVTINRSNTSRNHFKDSSSTSGGIRGIFPSVPLFGYASGAKTSREFEREFFSNDFTIEFEIVQGIVDRPWLDLAFLESRAYTTVHPGTKARLDEVNDIVTLSDGEDSPGGVMPLIPMTAYFLRNLTLSTSMDSNRFESERDKLSGRGRISLLGFGARVRHTSNTVSTEEKRENQEGKIKMNGTFLIGFASRYLGKAPNPDFESHPNEEDWI